MWQASHKGPRWQAFGKGLCFFSMKGQPLHQGFKGVVLSIIGDHEYFSNTLGLPYWSSHYPCWERDAENEVYTHENCLVDPWSDHALFKLPGTSSCMVRGDPLHILFCKGLYSHLMGGVLHYLCYFEGPRVRTTKNPLRGYQCSSYTAAMQKPVDQPQAFYDLRPKQATVKASCFGLQGWGVRTLAPCSHPCPQKSFCRHHRDL